YRCTLSVVSVISAVPVVSAVSAVSAVSVVSIVSIVPTIARVVSLLQKNLIIARKNFSYGVISPLPATISLQQTAS
ncbi:MAG: hypothetical protein IKK05_02490, partial [Alistipes sp.]|nr:hypothetical protein [Alistipes sp.]